MKYYSIDAERELSAERLELPADLVGHHLRLQFACAVHECVGGMIRDCRRWSDNRWRRLGLTKRTIRRLEKAGLVRWLDNHLLTHGFNGYGLQVLLERRVHASNIAKVRWSRHAARSPAGNAKDRSPLGDLGDRSGRPPIATAKASSSSSSIEVVDAGGGGLPDGVWERIWAELPNTRSYWQGKARQAIEAVVVPDEVAAFLDFLNHGKKTKGWQRSPPTPLTIASDFRDRRRPPPAARTKSNRTQPRQLPSRDDIRASWAGVVNRSRTGKETGT